MTAIAKLSRADAIARIAGSLHVPCDGTLSVPLIAQATRRAAYVLAPCGVKQLASAVRTPLLPLVDDPEQLTEQIKAIIEDLVALGDILELTPSLDDMWAEQRFVLRPAPPSFVQRPAGDFVLLGIAGDAITPLAGELAERLEHRGGLRILRAHDGEDLCAELRALGLVALSERSWLRLPSAVVAASFVQVWRERVGGAAASASLDGLEIIGRASRFYPERWMPPAPSHHGLFMGRRPQRFGADLWCAVELAAGQIERFVDLVSTGDRQRPCDIAWRLQAALDRAAGIPQVCRRSSCSRGTRLDFFAPIPSWAERRLRLVGERARPERCLLRFIVPDAAADREVAFLQEMLWVEPERGDGAA